MTTTHNLSPALRQALHAIADRDGFIELPAFVNLALYHPELGYYHQRRQRVGRALGADFYTATAFRSAFAAIVSEAATTMADVAGLSARELDWVEIGAEPKQALLDREKHPFRSARTVELGQPLKLEGSLVVFSNELFDAQPFRQLRFLSGRWTEFGLRLDSAGLEWQPRAALSEEARNWLDRLPSRAPAGYIIDLPTGARTLARQIARGDWRGIFIAFDYGKSWQALIQETPQGTARGYTRHRMVQDILDQAGEQDITCHICWDDLEAELRQSGFEKVSLQSQEAFIAHGAPRFLQQVFDPARSFLDPLRGQLKELMHPALMGQKFQALSAIRA